MEDHSKFAPYSGHHFAMYTLPSGQTVHHRIARAIVMSLAINKKTHFRGGSLSEEVLTHFCEANGIPYTKEPKDMGANCYFDMMFKANVTLGEVSP